MSKSSSEIIPFAGGIVAVVVVAAIALAGAGGMRTPGGRTTAELALVPTRAPALNAARGGVRADLGVLPLAFEANQGQTDARVKYIARGHGYTLLLTTNGAVFALSSTPQTETMGVGGKHPLRRAIQIVPKTSEAKPAPSSTIQLQLVGGSSRARITASNQLPGRSNYFIGNDPTRWQTNVAQYACVTYRDVYHGVDLRFHGNQRQLEFDFIVASGATAAPIRFGVSAADRITMDAAGNLLLSSSAGDVPLHKPVAYQEMDGARQSVDVRFILQANNRIGFELGAYDPSRQLVIDPSVSYATYLGGTAEDDGIAIAIDSAGNAYVAGQTASTDFPVVAGDYSTKNAGGLDVFVTKISADGSTLLYSTYVGGSSDDSGTAIAVDASGNAFVAGQTASSTDFPITTGAFQKTFGGGDLDAFVFELNSTGTKLTYSTYLGGTGDDAAAGIALDRLGNTYIVGSTSSTNFPTLNAIQTSIAGISNGFVTKLNSSGSALDYSTYLGGGSGDFASAVGLDSLNQAYVTGATQNPTFPTSANAFQKTCGTDGTCNGGLDDAFVTVFKADDSGFVYSTFLGGESADQGYGIAVDSAGDAYVTGATASLHFPLKSPIQPAYGGGPNDAFVTVLNPAGSALLYSTYLGGSLNDTGTGIAIDGGSNVYVTGQTGSSDFPTVTPTQPSLGGDNDAFVTEINSTGSKFVFSTYLGGSLDENSIVTEEGLGTIGAIAVDRAGANIYVTGDTASTDFPTQAPHQANNAGLADAFVARYAQANFTISASVLSPPEINPGASASSTISVGALNGFSSPVALTCSVSPIRAHPPTCGFSSTSVSPGTPSTLTVATTSSTTAANYTVTVAGTSGGFVHTTSAGVAVQDFGIAASPLNPAAMNPGNSATSTVTVTAINGFISPVMLTCFVSPAPANAPTCGFSQTSVSPGTPSTLTVAAPASAPGGNYTISVTGTSGGDIHSTTVGLTVNGFFISATTPPAVNPGNSATSTVTLTALNGDNLSVTQACSVTGPGSPLPSCSATSFSPNPVTPTAAGAQTTLTITTTAPAREMFNRGRGFPAIWLLPLGILLTGVCLVSPTVRRGRLVGFLLAGLGITTLFLLPTCGGGESACSSVPNAPTGLTASATTSTRTTLNWTAPTTIGTGNCGAISYTIYQNATAIGTSTTTSFNVTGLSPSTSYTFTVTASDSAGMGPQGSPLSVTTGSGATPAGNYTITVTGADVNGLSNSTQITLTVN